MVGLNADGKGLQAVQLWAALCIITNQGGVVDTSATKQWMNIADLGVLQRRAELVQEQLDAVARKQRCGRETLAQARHQIVLGNAWMRENVETMWCTTDGIVGRLGEGDWEVAGGDLEQLLGKAINWECANDTLRL